MAGRLRSLKFLGLLTITAACFTPVAQKLASVPTEVNMVAGDTVSLPLAGSTLHQTSSSNQDVAFASSNSTSALTVTSGSPGSADIKSKLFGLIPWKTHVHVVPSAKVVLGGQAVGIRLQSKGPIVVGFRRLSDNTSPSAKAHVQVGDMILTMNHKQIHSATDLKQALMHASSHIRITVERGSTVRQLNIECPGVSGKRQLGLYVRDRTVGVGTLTFYDPKHHTFGALGHVITDVDTGQAVEGWGSLYNASITGLKPGEAGSPGEKRGTFSVNADQVGEIDKNTPYGIFGIMNNAPLNADSTKLVQVALPEQIHEGSAKMYTVVHGQTVESFDVRIDNVTRQTSPATKSMIIKVTDKRLLAETGGIIQGMSGSPIIQDGRLVGAVTHVFVSDPTRGYAVYAMWMLNETSKPNHATPATRLTPAPTPQSTRAV